MMILRLIILAVALTLWAVFGFLLWVALIFRAGVVVVFMSLLAAFTRQNRSEDARQLDRVFVLYPEGFNRIIETVWSNPDSTSAPHAPIASWEEVLYSSSYVVAFWAISVLFITLGFGLPASKSGRTGAITHEAGWTDADVYPMLSYWNGAVREATLRAAQSGSAVSGRVARETEERHAAIDALLERTNANARGEIQPPPGRWATTKARWCNAPSPTKAQYNDCLQALNLLLLADVRSAPEVNISDAALRDALLSSVRVSKRELAETLR